MSGIGADIAAVRNELGSSVTIVRTGKIEKIDSSLRDPARDPFTQEHHFDANFSYNTDIVPGDVLLDSGVPFLVMDRSSDDFEDEIVEYAAILFKCNLPATAKLVTFSSVTDPDTYKITSGWLVKCALVYGLIKTVKISASNNVGGNAGKDITFVTECTVPASYDTKMNDRLIVTDSVYFRVQNVDRFKYKDIHILTLVEDDRPVMS